MELTKKELQEIYYTGPKNSNAAQKLNISIPTMLRAVKKAGIPLKGHKNRIENYKINITDL